MESLDPTLASLIALSPSTGAVLASPGGSLGSSRASLHPLWWGHAQPTWPTKAPLLPPLWSQQGVCHSAAPAAARRGRVVQPRGQFTLWETNISSEGQEMKGAGRQNSLASSFWWIAERCTVFFMTCREHLIELRELLGLSVRLCPGQSCNTFHLLPSFPALRPLPLTLAALGLYLD